MRYMQSIIRGRLAVRDAIERRLSPDSGASAIEYALLVALIAIVIIVAVQFLGRQASETFSEAGASLAAVP